MRIIISLLLVITSINLSISQANIDSSSSSIEQYQKFDDDSQINAIIVDQNNDKWMGTNNGLYKFSAINSDQEVITQDFGVYALAKHPNHGIWIATDKGHLMNENLELMGKINFPPNAEVKSMDFFRNMLWIGTTDGLYKYNPRLKKFSKHQTTENSKLPSDTINMIYKDPNNILWIGTKEGLVRVKKKKWKIYNKGESFQAATHTQEGIWMVSEKEMYLIDGSRWYPAAVDKGLSTGDVRALASDSHGKIYLASQQLVQFDPYKDEIVVFDEDKGFSSSAAMALVSDQNDDIWIGTGDRGVFRVGNKTSNANKLRAIVLIEQEVECNGDATGKLSVKVSGGKKPYKYSWSNKGSNTSRLRDLVANKYVVTITDAEKNTYVANASLKEPRGIEISTLENRKISDITKSDGYVRISVDGGTPEYKIQWKNGKRGVELKRAKYGEHLVRITDANGCKAEYAVFVDKPKDFVDIDIDALSVGQTLRINQLKFDADSSSITQIAYPVLDDVYDFLHTNPNVIIEIGGHTNGIPPHAYCDKLSSQRARNVAVYLLNKGIPKKNITYKGYGKRNPLATNQSKSGRAKNQRVEVKIMELLK